MKPCCCKRTDTETNRPRTFLYLALAVLAVALLALIVLRVCDTLGDRAEWRRLAAPHGFVWMLRIPGAVSLSGSDTGKWTHFRLFGLIPVARLGSDANHARAAFGRYVAEALFWTPAALLPGPGIDSNQWPKASWGFWATC